MTTSFTVSQSALAPSQVTVTDTSTDREYNWVIYKITSPNGRIYIGKSKNYLQRVRQYKCLQLKKQNLISRSLIKYGFDAHKFEIIDSFLGSPIYAEGKEMFWIRGYMSNRCKYLHQNGLNMTDGGEGITGIKRTDSYKEKCRQRNLGKTLSEEHRKNISKKLKGRKGISRPCTADQKAKILSKIIGLKRSPEQISNYRKAQAKINGKKILVENTQTGTSVVYDSISEAARNIGIHKDNIINRVNGKVITAPIMKNRIFNFKLI